MDDKQQAAARIAGAAARPCRRAARRHPRACCSCARPRRSPRCVPEGNLVGLYHAIAARSADRRLCPLVLSRTAAASRCPGSPRAGRRCDSACWDDPYEDEGLEVGPYGACSRRAEAPRCRPEVVFVPLVGFTAEGDRLGQGGGHYDRWLAAHPDTSPSGWPGTARRSIRCRPSRTTIRSRRSSPRPAYYGGTI